MSEKNIQIVQSIYAAFGRGDVPAVMEHISDELRHFGIVSELADVPWHLQITKKKDVPLFFMAVAESLEFTRFEPREFAATGEHVYCTVGGEATMKKNGKKRAFEHEMHHFTLQNGRVVEWRCALDTAKEHKVLFG